MLVFFVLYKLLNVYVWIKDVYISMYVPSSDVIMFIDKFFHVQILSDIVMTMDLILIELSVWSPELLPFKFWWVVCHDLLQLQY